MTKPDQTTLGSTVADASPAESAEQPALATFDREEPRFALAEELGRGGMGRVVAAVDVALARSVAIKQVLSVSPEDLARFEREVRITAQLEHPSIVPIHEAARDAEGRPYYVMRRIDGDPLSRRLEGANTGARLAMLPNFLAVVDAAAFAHARNIIHRDIKPSNILLGNYGETHLIDWGLARRLDDVEVSTIPIDSGKHELTRAGHIYGTIAYMPPEQARGERVDQRADVYALGATLFHVLAGKAPFAGLSDAERIAAAEEGQDRIPLDQLDDEIPHELIAIVNQATARDPDARYQHAGELAADVRAFLAGKLVAAHRYTIGQRIRRLVRAHRLAVGVGTVALVAMIAISIGLISRIVGEKQEAEAASQLAAARGRLAEAQGALAADRFYTALLDRASLLLRSDPTQAVVLVRDIPADIPAARRARDLVAGAVASGVVRGDPTHIQQIDGLAFSHDHEWLASVGEDGKVVLHDVATAGSRVIAQEQTAVTWVTWSSDDSRLIFAVTKGGIRAVDVATGKASSLAAAEPDGWWWSGTNLRYLDARRHAVFEVSERGGAERELAGEVIAAAGAGDTVFYLTTANRVRVLERDTTRDLGVGPPAFRHELAYSSRLGRAAIRGASEVVEWDLGSGKQVGVWHVPVASGLAYSWFRLVIVEGNHRMKYLLDAGQLLDSEARITQGWRTEIAGAVAFVTDTGALTIENESGIHTLPFNYPGTRALSATPDGKLVAFGNRSGLVRWLDLSTQLPRPIPFDRGGQVCLATTKRVVGISAGEVVDIDLATGTTRVIANDAMIFDLAARCSIPSHNWIALYGLGGGALVDLTTKRTILRQGSLLAIVDDQERLVLAQGTAMTEWNAGAETPILTTEKPIDSIAAFGGWVVAVDAGGTVTRKHRETGRIDRAHVEGIADKLGLLPDGTLWFTIDDTLWDWRPAQPPRALHSFGFTVRSAANHEHEIYLQLVDGSLWAVGVGDHRIRSLAPSGTSELAFGIADTFVSQLRDQVTTHFLASGDSFARDVPAVRTVRMLDNGRDILAVRERSFVVFHDPVPLTFAEVVPWISTITNAEIDPDTHAIRWRAPR